MDETLPSGLVLRVTLAGQGEVPAWDTFVAGLPLGHHEQTSLWAQVKSRFGWDAARFLLRRDGQIIAGAQMLVRHHPLARFLGPIGYIPKGPVTAIEAPGVLEHLSNGIHRLARHFRLAYLVVEPPYPAAPARSASTLQDVTPGPATQFAPDAGQALAEHLVHHGFSPAPRHLPPSGLVGATVLLDLAADCETLFRQMRHTTQRNIRSGLHKGVHVREGTGQDIDLFRDLLWASCARLRVTPSPPQRDFFHELWRVFATRGWISLFLAECQNRIVTAGLVFPFGDCVRLWKVGWSGLYPDWHPNKVLWWHVIQWARARNFKWLEFVGLEEKFARASLQTLHSSAPLDTGRRCNAAKGSSQGAVSSQAPDGASNFKLSFGGRIVALPGPCCRVYRRTLRVLFRLGGARLLNSHWTDRFLKGFRETSL